MHDFCLKISSGIVVSISNSKYSSKDLGVTTKDNTINKVINNNKR